MGYLPTTWYPWNSSRWLFDPPDSEPQGGFGNSLLSGAFFGAVGFNAGAAQNDDMRWFTVLSPGTWKMVLYSWKGGTNYAIATIDFSQDNGATWTSIGTVDLYATTPVAQTTTFSSLTVPRAGSTWVRFRALTRNGSNTTGWFLGLSGMSWIRTA